MTTHLYTADTIKAWDAYTLRQQQISSLQLMEQAAKACVDELLRHFGSARKILILAGAGNNGGDGLAMARLLSEHHLKVTLYRLPASTYSLDNAAQWQRLRETQVTLVEDWDPGLLQGHDLVVDALLGIGVNRPLTGLLAQIVSDLTTVSCPLLSIDLPSGLPAEQAFEGDWPIVNATHTFTLGSYKLNLLLPHAAPFVGKLSCLEFGLSRDFKPTNGLLALFSDVDELAQFLPKRGTFSHKGSFGHALLIAGSDGKGGAAILAGQACLRCGAGLTSMAVPQELQVSLALTIPEAMGLQSGVTFWTKTIATDRYTAIGVGPGLGTEAATLTALLALLADATCPLVLDADALNILAAYPGGLDLIPSGSVLTPHVKEFDRLFGQHPNWWSRLATLQAQADMRGWVLVLKNAYTFIATPHAPLRVNMSGNPGLAKGGSGDVLTGILTSLLAQGIPAAQAAVLGVWLHGNSADQAVHRFGAISLLATDVIASLPATFALLDAHRTK